MPGPALTWPRSRAARCAATAWSGCNQPARRAARAQGEAFDERPLRARRPRDGQLRPRAERVRHGDPVRRTPHGAGRASAGCGGATRRRASVHEAEARVVVLAGGSVESPRLWLNSGLPELARRRGPAPDEHAAGLRHRVLRPRGPPRRRPGDDGAGRLPRPRHDVEPGVRTAGVRGRARRTADAGSGTSRPAASRGTSPGACTGPRRSRRIEEYQPLALRSSCAPTTSRRPTNRVHARRRLGPTSTAPSRRSPTPDAALVGAPALARPQGRGDPPGRRGHAGPPHATSSCSFTHIMSTMRIGRDPATSVCDPDGQAHEVEGCVHRRHVGAAERPGRAEPDADGPGAGGAYGRPDLRADVRVRPAAVRAWASRSNRAVIMPGSARPPLTIAGVGAVALCMAPHIGRRQYPQHARRRRTAPAPHRPDRHPLRLEHHHRPDHVPARMSSNAASTSSRPIRFVTMVSRSSRPSR